MSLSMSIFITGISFVDFRLLFYIFINQLITVLCSPSLTEGSYKLRLNTMRGASESSVVPKLAWSLRHHHSHHHHHYLPRLFPDASFVSAPESSTFSHSAEVAEGNTGHP